MKKKLAVVVLALWLPLTLAAQIIFGYTTVTYEYILNSYVDATPIGSHSPSTGAFTSLSAASATITSIVGALTGNVTGNVSGNAGTASALAASPNNCAAGVPALGITANGTANCFSSTYKAQGLAITSGICSTSGSETKCTMSPVSWPTAFADSGYQATCTYAGSPTGTGTLPGLSGPYVVGQTASTITIQLQSGSNAAGGNNTVSGISCTGIHN